MKTTVRCNNILKFLTFFVPRVGGIFLITSTATDMLRYVITISPLYFVTTLLRVFLVATGLRRFTLSFRDM